MRLKDWYMLHNVPWYRQGTSSSNICWGSFYFQPHFAGILMDNLLICSIECALSVFIDLIEISFPLLWIIYPCIWPIFPLDFPPFSRLHRTLYILVLRSPELQPLLLCLLLCTLTYAGMFGTLLGCLWTNKNLIFDVLLQSSALLQCYLTGQSIAYPKCT